MEGRSHGNWVGEADGFSAPINRWMLDTGQGSLLGVCGAATTFTRRAQRAYVELFWPSFGSVCLSTGLYDDDMFPG